MTMGLIAGAGEGEVVAGFDETEGFVNPIAVCCFSYSTSRTK